MEAPGQHRSRCRGAALTTNSSTLGLSKVAAASGRPDRVCNMHFFNRTLVMDGVEVVRHPGTSQDTGTSRWPCPEAWASHRF